jgi:hypothetical protein
LAQIEESSLLLRQIDAVLQSAGWKRVKPLLPSVTSILVFGKDVDFAVPSSLLDGIHVAAKSSSGQISSNGTPVSCRDIGSAPFLATAPPPVKAAITLEFCLSSHLSPSQEYIPIGFDGMSPTVIEINVGKKPITTKQIESRQTSH